MILTDNEINLVLVKVSNGNIDKDIVPAYHFSIQLMDKTQVGVCDLRVGHNEKLYYGGNIGYSINPQFRGNGYATKACNILREYAKNVHNMDYLIITCKPENIPSKLTCIHAGYELIDTVELPEDNDMYQRGERFKCIYKLYL